MAKKTIVKYKAEIYNNITDKYDVIEGSDLKGLYAYLLHDTDKLINTSIQDVGIDYCLVDVLADALCTVTYFCTNKKISDKVSTLFTLQMLYEDCASDDDNEHDIAAERALVEAMLNKLRQIEPLLTDKILDKTFKKFALNDTGFAEQRIGFKYHSKSIQEVLEYTINIEGKRLCSPKVLDCYNFLIDNLDSMSEEFGVALDTLMANIQTRLDEYPYSDDKTSDINKINDTVTEQLAKSKANKEQLLNEKTVGLLKKLGSLFTESDLDTIIQNFKHDFEEALQYGTKWCVKSEL